MFEERVENPSAKHADVDRKLALSFHGLWIFLAFRAYVLFE